MESRAYVLIEAESGAIATILEALRGVAEVSSAEAVTGPYDIIACISTTDSRGIGRVIMHHIHVIPGIKRTVTCMVIG